MEYAAQPLVGRVVLQAPVAELLDVDGVASSSSMTVAPRLQKAVRYDPLQDFEFVSLVALLPNVLVCNTAPPVAGVAEFVAEPDMSVAAFDGFMRSERTRWAGIVKAIGITAA